MVSDVPAGTPLDALREGEDYLASPGGVTRMLGGLSRHLLATGRVRAVDWVSLSRSPASLRLGEGARLEYVSLPRADVPGYAVSKGALWDWVHGLPGDGHVGPRSVQGGLARLAHAMGERTRALHDEDPYDVAYVHDFQLLEMGAHLPSDLPRVFRWHIPVPALSGPLRDYVARSLDAFDAVLVSTRRYAAQLRRWGVRAPIHASYPYLDGSRRRVVTASDLAAFDARWGLDPEDMVFLVVARLDPMKSQDVAIRALARIARDHPRARLLLVGGGGFSAGRQGLGMTHATQWREHLAALARDLGVEDRVVFTGGIPDEDLDVAYTRARAVLLPSAIEGFGLAPVEGWLYGRPVVVSRGAGVAELVRHGGNGFLHGPGDDAALARGLDALAADEDLAHALGKAGRAAARSCSTRRRADDVWDVLEGAMERASWSPRRPRWG